MILVDYQIKALCESGMIQPFDPSLVNPASLDVRLGDWLLIESVEDQQWVPLSIANSSSEDPYLLKPGQFVLAETFELFNIPNNLAAQFVLKSSRAREGLQHLLAGYIDPGWHGSRLTLELKNIRQLHSVGVWPGMKIGQIVFKQLSSRPLQSYAVTGRYNGDQTVTASKG
jgi:dCTP deaminase